MDSKLVAQEIFNSAAFIYSKNMERESSQELGVRDLVGEGCKHTHANKL